MSTSNSHPRVLAIAPFTEGFGYAIFNAPDQIIDWGVSAVTRRRLSINIERFSSLVEQCQPDIIVISERDLPTKPGLFASRLIQVIKKRLAVESCSEQTITHSQIRALFALFNAQTKQEIAAKIIEFLPKLELYRPKHRPVWEREDRKMKIFDAAAVAITYYAQLEENNPHPNK